MTKWPVHRETHSTTQKTRRPPIRNRHIQFCRLKQNEIRLNKFVSSLDGRGSKGKFYM